MYTVCIPCSPTSIRYLSIHNFTNTSTIKKRHRITSDVFPNPILYYDPSLVP